MKPIVVGDCTSLYRVNVCISRLVRLVFHAYYVCYSVKFSVLSVCIVATYVAHL